MRFALGVKVGVLALLMGVGSGFTGLRGPRFQASSPVSGKVGVSSHHDDHDPLATVGLLDTKAEVVLKRGKARLFVDGELLVYGGAVEGVYPIDTPSPQNAAGMHKEEEEEEEEKAETEPSAHKDTPEVPTPDTKRRPKKLNAAEALRIGDVVTVVTDRGQVVGWGFYNHESMFRVRLIARAATEGHGGEGGGQDLGEVLKHLVARAMRRRRWCGLPGEATNAYRLLNSEGDGTSGLVVDVFGNVAVVSSSAAWCERYRDLIEKAVLDVGSSGGVRRVVWQQAVARLKQDGVEVETPPAPAEGRGGGAEVVVGGEGTRAVADDVVNISELGLRYAVSLARGQKTGFYCDQRMNRELMARYVRPGDRVLDLCCYSGGFSLHAARTGAGKVTGVDSSAVAVDLARRNAAANGLATGNGDGEVEFVVADISTYMREARERGERYDVIVLDPPKLAPNRRALERAKTKYTRLNTAAMKLIAEEGGILVTCTCSSAMTRSGQFPAVLRAAAARAGRSIVVLSKEGAAPDHVVNPSCEEGEYLTAVFLHVA